MGARPINELDILQRGSNKSVCNKEKQKRVVTKKSSIGL